MKVNFMHMENIHPMVIFWLGLLTGALIVGLIFSYRIYSAIDSRTSLLTAPGTYVSGPEPTPWMPTSGTYTTTTR